MSWLQFLFELDKEILLAVNGWSGAEWLDQLMILASAKWTWIPLYALLALAACRKLGLQNFTWFLVGVLAMIILSDQGSVVFFKDTFHRLRPCHDPTLTGDINLVSGRCGGQFGFISSHASNVFALATLIFLVLKDNLLWLLMLMVWACWVSISRVYLGVHFPLDILVGSIYGISVGFFTARLLERVITLR